MCSSVRGGWCSNKGWGKSCMPARHAGHTHAIYWRWWQWSRHAAACGWNSKQYCCPLSHSSWAWCPISYGNADQKSVRRESDETKHSCSPSYACKGKGRGYRFHVTTRAHMTVTMTCSLQWRCQRVGTKRPKMRRRRNCSSASKCWTQGAHNPPAREVCPVTLNVKELDILLAWHQAPKVRGAKKADRLVLWQNIVASKMVPPLFACETNDDEERMNGLMAESIGIADTHYGWQVVLSATWMA